MQGLGWLLVLVLAASAAQAAAPAGTVPVVDVDLAKPFATRSAWRLTATQDPPIDGATDGGDNELPGKLRLCLRRGGTATCDAALQDMLHLPAEDEFDQPYYLPAARVVQVRGGEKLLMVQEGSMHAGDGDQLILTQLLAYRRGEDRFVRVYQHLNGLNNNQDVRLIESGPLAGAVVSVDPTEDAPYGFWVVVSMAEAGAAFQPRLRYRSATRYDDGNPLAVIDSEMPGIEQRLGLWHPGMPLPVPAGTCPKPHLIHMELWCK